MRKIKDPFCVVSLYVAIFTDAALSHFLLPVMRAERNEAPVHRIFYDFLENCHIFWLKCTYEIILSNTGTNFRASRIFIFYGVIYFHSLLYFLAYLFSSPSCFFFYTYFSPYLFSIQGLEEKYR